MDYKKILDKINIDYFKDNAEKFRETDKDSILDELIEKKDKLFAILEKDSPISKVIDETKMLFSMVQDYSKGDYKEIAWTSIAGVIGTLLYVISPLDFIPDIIPFIGMIDDVAVVALCFELLRDELKKYQIWKKSNGDIIDVELLKSETKFDDVKENLKNDIK